MRHGGNEGFHVIAENCLEVFGNEGVRFGAQIVPNGAGRTIERSENTMVRNWVSMNLKASYEKLVRICGEGAK